MILPPFEHRGNEQRIFRGRKAISRGEAGCVIIAGGQATRLKSDGPKGAVPVSVIRNKSLFQLFAEKTIAAGKDLPLAFMVSEANAVATEAFFAAHNLFGLKPEQLSFFIQNNLPLQDEHGQPFYIRPGELAMGPDGNGSFFECFSTCGLWEEWHRKGVRYVSVALVDNPLADPFDAEMIGYQEESGAEVVVKCVERIDPEEKVGVIVQKNEHIEVVEYGEFPQEENCALDADGRLKHRLANISAFSFSMPFLKAMAAVDLPLHRAHKISPYLDLQGNTLTPTTPNAWKLEKFIFDVLPLAQKVGLILYPREECFAPLKNATGNHSLETVRAALWRRDRQLIEQLTGLPAPEAPIELSQEFYYPDDEMRQFWKGKAVSAGVYVEGAQKKHKGAEAQRK